MTNYMVTVGATILNTGTIAGLGYAGLWLAGTGSTNLRVENDGVITGANFGIMFSTFNGQPTRIVNTGRVTGDVSAITGSGDSGAVVIINSGTIATGAGSAAIQTGSGPSRIVNSGEIIGSVVFNSGNDVFDGRGGTVRGTVTGAAGNDTYIIDDPGIEIVELAGGGSDTIVSFAADFVLPDEVEVLDLRGLAIGGTGNDLANAITGNGLANRLAGEGGNDTIQGFRGADTIDGGDGNDSVLGGTGDDDLRGGDGFDTLRGGSGDDRIAGGLLGDHLFGEGGTTRSSAARASTRSTVATTTMSCSAAAGATG